jgi:hypothetical protein
MMATGSRALRSEGAANLAMAESCASIGRHFHKPAGFRRSRAGFIRRAFRALFGL